MHRLILLALVAVAAADHCGPEIAVENFKFDEFAEGTWYEFARFKSYNEQGKQCIRTEYSLQGDMSKVKKCKIEDGKESCEEGFAKMDPEADNRGKLIFSYPHGPRGQMTDSKMSIVATDYKTYAIQRFCSKQEDLNIHWDLSWVMTRSKHPSAEEKERIKQIIKDIPALERRNFIFFDYTDDDCKVTV